MIRVARILILAIALALPTLAVHRAASAETSVRAAAGAAQLIGPKKYYLVLGDSLAFGFQPSFKFNEGYANDWFNDTLKQEGTRYIVNLACNGETTTTFIYGKCPYPFYKVPYRTTQLDKAIRFIKNHPNEVSPVTVDIGANDVLAGLDPTTCAVTSTEAISSIEQTVDRNYQTILYRLKTALTTTVNGQSKVTGDLFTMNYYDPYQNQCAANPQVYQLFTRFNEHIQADANALGVRWADVFTAFGGAGNPANHNINPDLTGTSDGTCPAQSPYVTSTAYTWICLPSVASLPGASIHPTALGYTKIAAAFQSLAGY